MNRLRTTMIWCGLASLLIVSLACAAPALPGAQPTATLWIMPTLAPLPGAETGGDQGGTKIEDEGVGGGSEVSGGLEYPGIDTSSFTSFRSEFRMSWSGVDENGVAEEGSYTAIQAYIADPPSTFTKWDTTSSTTGESGSFEWTQIGDVMYMNSADEGEEPTCITTSQEGAETNQSPPFSPDTWLSGSDLSTAQLVDGNENVNGVSTSHYRQTNVEGALAAGFTNYEVNIWIANDGNYVVRETLVGDGPLLTEGSGEGHMEWEYNLLDVNGPVTIEPPANCEAPVGSDFPKMADATGVSTFGATLTYTTASPIADVVAFYNEQLPPLGWSSTTESTDVPGMATLEFTQGDETVSILITESEGVTTVLISFIGPEG